MEKQRKEHEGLLPAHRVVLGVPRGEGVRRLVPVAKRKTAPEGAVSLTADNRLLRVA
jgi:hypothetical protein